MTESENPEQRAEAAARDLADRGKTVTARAVREAAGVRMAVASDAARAWREAAAENAEIEVPDTPEDVTARLNAVWPEAYRAAVAIVSPEKDRLAEEVKELHAEVEALTGTVSEVEDERDVAIQQREEAQKAQATAEDELQQVTQTLTTREATIAELRDHNQRLNDQLTSLISRIPSTETTEEKDS